MKQLPYIRALLTIVVSSTSLSACISPDAPGALVPATVDHNPSLPAIELRDTRLRFEEHGDPSNPTIILLHGGPGSGMDALARLAELSRQSHHVIIYDQRGAGLSRRHDAGSVSITEHIADLDAIISESPANQVTLVGHSWGGMLAAAYTEAHPERVSSIIFLDPGPFNAARWEQLEIDGVDTSAPHINELLWAEQTATPSSHERADWHFLQIVEGQLPGYNMSDVDPMPIRRFGAVAYYDTMTSLEDDGGSLAFDLTDELGNWPGTAHFIWGTRNVVMSPDYRRAQEADFVRFTSRHVDAGHDLIWVTADQTHAAMLEVLQ